MTKTERPILLQAEMVKAILEGRKTQTRQPLIPQPVGLPAHAYCDPYNKNPEHFTFWTADNKMILGCGGNIKNTCHWRCHFGIPGHKLWVKETFIEFTDNTGHACVVYKADGSALSAFYQDDGQGDGAYVKGTVTPACNPERWKDAGYMPGWASRITLEIESIRVERLHDINEADAIAEGIKTFTKDGNLNKFWMCDPFEGKHRRKWVDLPRSPIESFEFLWDQSHAATRFAWAFNPWVYVITFKKL